MFDFEKLIIEVESRPCLWDIGSKDYHDKPMKMLAWNSVAAALYPNWEELSAAQKEEKAKDLKEKKWRHVRDNFMKYINQEKNIKSGSGTTKRKKYHFADMLSFLKPNLDRRSTSGNFINDTQDDQQVSDTDDPVEDHNKTLLDPSQQLDTSILSAQDTPPSTSKINKKNPKMTIFQSKLLNHLEKVETTDADEHFLKSLLPEVKKLSDGKKLEFKMYVLNFFQNESRPQNINYSYPTSVIHQQNNAPYFHPGYLNSFNSSPISYQHQQASPSLSSIDTHHNIYSEPIPANQYSQLPYSENIPPHQPKPVQQFPLHNAHDGNQQL